MNKLVLEYEGTFSLDTSIFRAIQREIDMLMLALRLSKDALAKFEERYQISSAEFFKKMERGELGDTEDFIEWAGEYELLQRTQDELAELQTLKICL